MLKPIRSGASLLALPEDMRREEKRLDAARLVVVSALVPILRQTAELAGFEIIGRIPLRDKATGKEYR